MKKTLKIKEIRQKIKHGDRRRIAEVVGCSLRTVNAILLEERNANTPTGEKIIKVANQMIAQHENLIKEYKENENSN